MALGTRAPEENQEDIDRRFDDIATHNQDLDSAIDQKYAQGHGAYQPNELNDAESTSSPYTDAGADQAAAYANDPANHSDEVREAETGTPGNWANRVKGGAAAGGKQPFSLKKLGKTILTKKGAATGGIAGILVAGGVGLSAAFSPALMLVHIKEVLVDRFNTQNTTLTVRYHKIATKKLAQLNTKGCTGPITITCKFSKMSNKALKTMSDEGIVAYKDGEPLDVSDGKSWKSERPDEFRVQGDAAKSFGMKEGQGIHANEYVSFLDKNPGAAGIQRKAFNPGWAASWDTTMTKYLNKIGFGGRGPKITGDDEKSVKDSVKENADKVSKGEKLGAAEGGKDTTKDENGKTVEKEDPNSKAAAEEVNSGIDAAREGGDPFKEVSKKIGKATSGPLMIIGAYCLIVHDAPKISKAVRLIQIAQLATYALTFLQVADEIKTSNSVSPASAARISTIGSMFTQSQKDSKGNYIKKSAVESDGLLYGLEGNTSFKSTTSDINNWIPGGGMMRRVNEVAKALKGDFGSKIDTACEAFESPAGQVLQFALAPTWGGLAAMIAGNVITKTPIFQRAMESFMKALAGSLVHNTDLMEDLGNAFAVGSIYSMSESGNAGATMPLKVDQAVAYSEQTQQVRLANAKVDRATLSPFDASSPNTFMGSIVTKMMPYYGAIHSGPLGAMGAVVNVVSSTFSSMLTPKASAYASLTSEDLRACGDTSITDSGTAADYICNVQYGIPVEYLNSIDPDENASYLVGQKLVKDDGEGGGYEDDDSIVQKMDDGRDSPMYTFLSTCRQTEDTVTSPLCKIDTEDKARYALYYIDHRIQKDMDGEDEYKSDASVTAASSGSSNSATTGSGAAIGDYKPGSYQCAAWVGQLVLPDIYGIANPHGNGNEIAPNLGKMGYKVDSTPAVHSIVSWPAYCNCQGGSSSAGHVGVVDAVNADGSIVVEAYNSHGDEKYAVTPITAANAKKLQYAHVEAKFGTGPVKVGSSS